MYKKSINDNIFPKNNINKSLLNKDISTHKSLINNDLSIQKNSISNKTNILNETKNNSLGMKKYETLVKKKSKKSNININININNNNKVIYNKILGNKSPSLNNKQKIIKSPTLQKIRTFVNNNSTFEKKNHFENKKITKLTKNILPKTKLLNLYNNK